MKHGSRVLMGILCGVLAVGSGAANGEAEGAVILDDGSPWRYYEVWATDIAQTEDGSLVPVDPVNPAQIQTRDGEWENENINNFGRAMRPERRLNPATDIAHSPLPPDNWRAPDFADHEWPRVRTFHRHGRPHTAYRGDNGVLRNGELMAKYRALALICLRGKFVVDNPAATGGLTLDLQFRGGVAVFVNGREIGRSHLPEGALAWDTLAEDYPWEVYANAEGNLLNQSAASSASTSYFTPEHLRRWVKDDADRLAQRTRQAAIHIPADALVPGVNVIAIELHRAPAPERMFIAARTAQRYPMHGLRMMHWWNRVSLERVALTAAAEAGVRANVAAAPGMKVVNHPAGQDVNDWLYADPHDRIGPLTLAGARNGAYAGALIVSSPSAITNISIQVGDLVGNGGVIPGRAVDVLFQNFDEPGSLGYNIMPAIGGRHFHTLDRGPPDVLSEMPYTESDMAFRGGRRQMPPFVTQPVWFVVNIPADASPGMYRGTAVITAEGEPDTTVPIEVEVIGSSWALPDTRDWRTFVVFNQSPETLALHYGVPLWSEAHWALVEESLRLLGQLGNKEALVTFTSKTYVGNEDAMLRFVRGVDGDLKADFSIVDRYLELAARHMGPIPSVCTIISYGAGSSRPEGHGHYGGPPQAPQRVTVYEPSTGEAQDELVPDWGTPEALTFWKPVFDEYRQIMAKHGVGPAPVMYWSQFSGVNPRAFADLKQIVPDIKHMNRTHIAGQRHGPDRFYCSLVASGGSGVHWDPDLDRPFYGWRQPLDIISAPREGAMGKANPGLRDESMLTFFRYFPEHTLLNGRVGRAFDDDRSRRHIYRAGFGQFGADFWPVTLPGDAGAEGRTTALTHRYFGESSAGYHLSTILGAGRAAPSPTGRFQMMREGLQEAEAMMFIVDAMLDHPDVLGPELAARCRNVLDGQVRLLRHFIEFNTSATLAPQVVQAKARELFVLADEVALALNQP